MVIEKKPFGTTKQGENVFLYTLTNALGTQAQIITYGAAIRSLIVNGKTDVALGYETLADYEAQDKYMGAIVGRFANRLEDAQFVLHGTTYTLYKNNGDNSLHGGKHGFDKRVWKVEEAQSNLCLSLFSPDGEEGYPGNLTVRVTYELIDENALSITYESICDADTILNLTNHTYFNLDGHNSGTIENHTLTVFSKEFTPNDSESLPTGKILSVLGTPFDFTSSTRIGERIRSNHEQLHLAGGYDHNFVLDTTKHPLALAARLKSTDGSITMETLTTQPGMQFYSGNFLDGVVAGKGNASYPARSGLCLETQLYPNCMKHKQFPSPILKKGDTLTDVTVYRFT